MVDRESDLQRPNYDYAAELAAIPFVACATCGVETRWSPCAECLALERKRAERSELDKLLGIPPRFAFARFEPGPNGTITIPQLLRDRVLIASVQHPGSTADPGLVRAHVRAHRGPVITFMGPSGGGKTTFASALLREMPGAMFVRARTLETARIESRAGEEPALVRRALWTRLLLIDDLGQDKGTSTSSVEEVINARHDANLPTWVTTGLTAEKIAKDYNDGVRRRLTDPKTEALVIRFLAPHAQVTA